MTFKTKRFLISAQLRSDTQTMMERTRVDPIELSSTQCSLSTSVMRRLNWSSECLASQRPIRHLVGRIAKAFAMIGRQSARPETETNALRTVLSSVAFFTVQFGAVLSYFSGIQKSVAQWAFETKFVPFVSAGNHLFSRVYRFAAFRAFGNLGCFEGHCVCAERERKTTSKHTSS